MKKRCVKMLAGVLTAFTLVASVFPGTSVKAETQTKTYTVTFRAGNVGSFNLNANNISGENIEATENYIKFTVAKGESLSSTFDFISDTASLDAYFLNVTSATEEAEYIDAGYRLKGAADWAPEAAETAVRRNTEYVLDYGKLVNPVKYTIKFVDVESEEQIAPPTIAYGNGGEEILCNPLQVAGYSTEEEAVSLTLQGEEGAVNEVTFHYTYTGEVETITNTVTTYEPGETVTETVVNEVVIETPGGATIVEPENTPAAQDTPAVQETPEDQENPGQVDIPEPDVPLDDGNDTPENQGEAEDNNEIVNIDDDPTPLAPGSEEASATPYWAPVFASVAAVVVLVGIVLLIMRRKQTVGKVRKK